ncbi:MAG: FeoA family protein [Kiritimatiellia bacterium]
MKYNVPLSSMLKDESGTITGLEGGRRFGFRLEAMGVRAGTELTVVNKSCFRGPVTVKMGNAQIALGHGMAEKIIMEVDREQT